MCVCVHMCVLCVHRRDRTKSMWLLYGQMNIGILVNILHMMMNPCPEGAMDSGEFETRLFVSPLFPNICTEMPLCFSTSCRLGVSQRCRRVSTSDVTTGKKWRRASPGQTGSAPGLCSCAQAQRRTYSSPGHVYVFCHAHTDTTRLIQTKMDDPNSWIIGSLMEITLMC